MTIDAAQKHEPSLKRLRNAGYFTASYALQAHLEDDVPLDESTRKELKARFSQGPDSPYPFEEYDLWLLEADFHDLVEALMDAEGAHPSSRRGLVKPSSDARRMRTRRARGKGRALPTALNPRVALIENRERGVIPPLKASAPSVARHPLEPSRALCAVLRTPDDLERHELVKARKFSRRHADRARP